MKKASLIIALVLLLIASTSCICASETKSKSISQPKIVSVLYDDSSSMHIGNNPSWSYANYAMQMFVALMNDNDTLLITYMSEPERVIHSNREGLLKTFSDNRQNVLYEIRNTTKGGDITPFSGIDTAAKALMHEKTADINTQYWLVVITDGAFEKNPGDISSETSSSEIDSKLSHYLHKEMPNGSKLKVIYMAIGDKAVIPNEAKNLSIKKSETIDIVNTISEIADQVSGRYRLTHGDYKIIDGNTVELNSSIPLLNIQVVTQNSQAAVVEASHHNGDSLNTNTVKVKSPNNIGNRTIGTQLNGNVITITSADEYIKKGTYKLIFDKKIFKEDVIILYEAALETKMTIKRDGEVIKDVTLLREGEVIDIYCNLVTMGTNKKIDPNTLPSGMFEGFTLNIDENGNNIVTTDKFVHKGYRLTGNETSVTATTTLKGFAPLTKQAQFTPMEPVAYGVHAQKSDLKLTLGEIKNNKKGIEFVITGDEQPLDRDLVKKLISKDSIEITHKGEKTGVSFTYKVKNDGTVIVTPTTSFINGIFMGVFTIPRGEYDIKVAVNNKIYDNQSFDIKFYSVFDLVLRLLLLLLLAILLRLFVFSKHFPSGVLNKRTYNIETDSRGRPVRAAISHISYNPGPRKIGFFTDFFGALYKKHRSIKYENKRIYAEGHGRIKWQSPNKLLSLNPSSIQRLPMEELKRYHFERYDFLKDVNALEDKEHYKTLSVNQEFYVLLNDRDIKIVGIYQFKTRS